MKIPKEIVDKMEQVNALTLEIDKWMYDNLDCLEGSKHANRSWHGEFIHEEPYQFTDKPTGSKQGDGEYCEQHAGYCEDDYYGKYYYPTEKGNYFWFDYSV